MPIVLRDYQVKLKSDIYDAWNSGHKNVLAVKPTGMGKTKTFCSIAIDLAISMSGPRFPTAILVHRKELVQQISLTLAEEGITHNIIAPKDVILGIIGSQRQLLGRQFYEYNANVTVISVDTLNARYEKHHKAWAKSIKFWITDEAAHVLRNNKWGKAVAYFTNAIGLGVTATPKRLDKRGLGRHADGVFDIMVEGPSTAYGIKNGHLCKYKIAIPTGDYRKYLKEAGEGADYTHAAMALASQKSNIVGDIVDNYIKFANGKQAIVFSDGIETAQKTEASFLKKGIKAKFLHGETPDGERFKALQDYRAKKIQVLLNVDLFDEGLDVPGIEVVILGRPTASLGKFLQMCGRGLRPDGDKILIIIDHVGNVMEHGLPDMPRIWTLDRIVKRRDTHNLLRICHNWKCNAPYDRALTECPWCGTEPDLRGGGGGGGGKPTAKQVDGDLELLDPETFMQMLRGSKLEDPAKVGERVQAVAGTAAGIQAMNNQRARIATAHDLSKVIALWAGYMKRFGYTDRQINKRFFLDFDKTITVALSEPRAEMLRTMQDLEGTYRP